MARERVIGVRGGRHDPTDRGQIAAARVFEHARLGRDHVIPLRTIANVLDRIEGRPDVAQTVQRRGVVAPRNAGGIRYIGERRKVEARKRTGHFDAQSVEPRYGRVRRRIAAPREAGRLEMVRIARGQVRLAGHEVEVGRKTGPRVRLKHVIGQGPALGHRPVRFDLRARDVGVGERRRLTRRSRHLIPAVHASVVVLLHERSVLVIDVGREVQIDRLERHPARVAESRGSAIRARKTLEEIIERAVLLNDDDHVLDVLPQIGAEALDRGRRRRRLGASGRAARGQECERDDERPKPDRIGHVRRLPRNWEQQRSCCVRG